MDVDARLEAVEEENERLREEVEELRRLYGVSDFVAPIDLRLTGAESCVLGALFRRDHCTKDQIMRAVYSARVDTEPQIKIIDVFVCKIRKKLAPFGITIGTLWGRGYYMATPSKAVLRDMLGLPEREAA